MNASLMREVLHRMATIRLAELYIARRYPEGTMRCPVHLCVGQESVAAVFGALARREDVFLGNYRSHGHFLAKGGSLVELFGELLGVAGGCSGGLGGSMHVIDREGGFYGSSAIVGSTVPIGAGVAFSFKRRGEGQVAVVFFGDAALEEGVVYETVNFATLHRLPLILVCENNGLAISTALELRTAAPRLWERFESMGLEGVRVDGADPSAMVSVATRAYEKARSGRGPSFVECLVTRWAAHVGHTVSGPVDAWWQAPFADDAKACPLARLAGDLLSGGHVTRSDLKRVRDEIQERVEQAFAQAATLERPEPEVLDRAVYASGLVSVLPVGARDVNTLGTSDYREPSKLVNPF